MENRGSEVPFATDRWVKFVNLDASGRDCYIHPNSIEAVEVRNTDPLRVRIQTSSKRITVDGTNAENLISWLNRISGIIIGAEL